MLRSGVSNSSVQASNGGHAAETPKSPQVARAPATASVELAPRPCLASLRHKWRTCISFRATEDSGAEKGLAANRWRWVILAVLSIDICISYIPYYTFVPIPRQSMQVYGVDESALNVLCILYALVFVPAAFVTGPIVATLGCRWTFVLAMALESIGCFIRCGPVMVTGISANWDELLGFHQQGPVENIGVLSSAVGGEGDAAAVAAAAMVAATPHLTSFRWLVLGQALCAIGQPLLVNSTSEMGVEWFPPNERPKAAMVSNLMNFVGGSLSFMIPPLFVGEIHSTVEDAEHEINYLLRFQLWLSVFSFTATLLLYSSSSAGRSQASQSRAPTTCISDVVRIFRCRDFWVVNGYFIVYISLCHAFDAVEGSLLEHYGYSASLTSWTGLSCSVASVLSTFFEARYITSATAYRGSLFAAAGFLALSQFIGFATLLWHLHPGMFVFAVFVMGLSTPGWGCSCELGAEVCYPAQEATVSSILEAFSNMGGVFSIILVQKLIDSGFGASVLAILGGFATLGGMFLHCLSGRLRRTEAEEAEEEVDEEEVELVGLTTCSSGGLPPALSGSSSPSKNGGPTTLSFGDISCLKGARRVPTTFACIGSMALFLLFCRLLLLLPQSQMPSPEAHNEMEGHEDPHFFHGKRNKHFWNHYANASGNSLDTNGALVVKNFVISCGTQLEGVKKMQRFEKSMTKAGLTFEVVPCAHGSEKDISAAVRDGLLMDKVNHRAWGVTTKGKDRGSTLGRAITHLRLLKRIAEGEAPLANIFEDYEVLQERFVERRAELLSVLPMAVDLVKLNSERPAGRRVPFTKTSWMYNRIFRMTATLSPAMNGGTSNYVVSKKGALRMSMLSRDYDSWGRWQTWDHYVLSKVYKNATKHGGFLGYSVATDLLSTKCSGRSLTKVMCNL